MVYDHLLVERGLGPMASAWSVCAVGRGTGRTLHGQVQGKQRGSCDGHFQPDTMT